MSLPRLDPRLLRAAVPPLAFAVLLAATFVVQPRAMSYLGLDLMFNLALPIAFATIAQMFILAINDLDLSIGSFVSMVACISATWLTETPLLGAAALVGCVAAYAGLGALIHLRRLPAIVVTLGMSFVWGGCAILILPSPGGAAPGWLSASVGLATPVLPLSVIAPVVLGLVVHFGLMRSAPGVVLRGAGGNPQALARAGWSLLRVRVTMYALAGLFGVLSGLILVGTTTSADANIAGRYTLLAIAGVILGGGEFTGGRVSPVGAVIGAMTLTLVGSLLSFLAIAPEWQIGAQGMMLVAVLALRAFVNRFEERAG